MISFRFPHSIIFTGVSIFLSVLLLSDAQASFLKISDGRLIDYNYEEVSDSAPTLVFLPGVNRSVPADYEALQALKKLKFNILTVATSSHWESLRHLKVNEIPFYVQKSDLNSADFMQEVDLLINKLKIQNPVLIGLSYSSSMQVYSKNTQIFVAPLVRSADSNPAGAQQAKNWEATLALNPIFGALWIRQFRDGNYRQYWSQKVAQELSRDVNFYEGIKQDQVINGYVSISRAAEDFELTQVDLGKSSLQQPHVFILGEHEQQNRIKGQVQTILQATKKKQPVQVIIVKNAEHNVPLSEPIGFAAALVTSLKTSNNDLLTVGVASRNNKKIDWLNATDIKKIFTKILNFSESSTELADLGL